MSKYFLPDEEEIFPNIVMRMAAKEPDEVFAWSVAGDSLTWGALHEQAVLWAKRFAVLGVERGATVASLTETGLGPLSWWTGLTHLGAAEVSINHEFRGRMLAYAINNCGAQLLVVSRQFLHLIESVATDLTHVTKVILADGEDEAADSLPFPLITAHEVSIENADLPAVEPQWHDIACIVYTSGTTGPSKAVRMPWAQLHAMNLGVYPFEDLRAEDVIYGIIPSYHMGSKSQPYLAAQIGGKIVMRERFSASEFWTDVERYGATTVALVGPAAETLMRNPDGPGPETTLRNVFMAPIIPSWKEFNERFGTRICTIYNSTEMSTPIRSSGWNPSERRSCGRIRDGYPGYEVRIVDEHDRELPDGVSGEVLVRTQVPWTLNAGYLNMPAETAAAWRNGWFHTGDCLMRTPEGDYVYVDRIKDAIRRRGENISSFEVEADVLAHPDVMECAAVAVPAEAGEDEILLFVVPRPGSNLSPEKLVRDLIPRMARFMVPRYVEFLDALPRTVATLRVRKVELRDRGIGPATWDRVAAGITIPR